MAGINIGAVAEDSHPGLRGGGPKKTKRTTGKGGSDNDSDYSGPSIPTSKSSQAGPVTRAQAKSAAFQNTRVNPAIAARAAGSSKAAGSLKDAKDKARSSKRRKDAKDTAGNSRDVKDAKDQPGSSKDVRDKASGSKAAKDKVSSSRDAEDQAGRSKDVKDKASSFKDAKGKAGSSGGAGDTKGKGRTPRHSKDGPLVIPDDDGSVADPKKPKPGAEPKPAPNNKKRSAKDTWGEPQAKKPKTDDPGLKPPSPAAPAQSPKTSGKRPASDASGEPQAKKRKTDGGEASSKTPRRRLPSPPAIPQPKRELDKEPWKFSLQNIKTADDVGAFISGLRKRLTEAIFSGNEVADEYLQGPAFQNVDPPAESLSLITEHGAGEDSRLFPEEMAERILARLPERERAGWRKSWKELDGLLKQILDDFDRLPQHKRRYLLWGEMALVRYRFLENMRNWNRRDRWQPLLEPLDGRRERPSIWDQNAPPFNPYITTLRGFLRQGHMTQDDVDELIMRVQRPMTEKQADEGMAKASNRLERLRRNKKAIKNEVRERDKAQAERAAGERDRAGAEAAEQLSRNEDWDELGKPAKTMRAWELINTLKARREKKRQKGLASVRDDGGRRAWPEYPKSRTSVGQFNLPDVPPNEGVYYLVGSYSLGSWNPYPTQRGGEGGKEEEGGRIAARRG